MGVTGNITLGQPGPRAEKLSLLKWVPPDKYFSTLDIYSTPSIYDSNFPSSLIQMLLKGRCNMPRGVTWEPDNWPPSSCARVFHKCLYCEHTCLHHHFLLYRYVKPATHSLRCIISLKIFCEIVYAARTPALLWIACLRGILGICPLPFKQEKNATW